MPRILGTPPCIGALGNVIFYQQNGKYFAKRKAYVPYERRMTDHRYIRQRENMAEMGMGAQVAGRIKKNWKRCTSHAQGSYIQSQMNARFVEIVRAGEGARGQRSVQLTQNGHLLEGFTYDKDRNPDHHFTHIPTVTTQETASGLRITLRFDPKARHNHRMAAAKDTHFSLYVNAVVISDHHSTPAKAGKTRALPLDPEAKEYFGSHESRQIPIGINSGKLPDLELEIEAPHHPEQAVIISYGLKYYHQDQGKMVSTSRAKPRSRLNQKNAYMRVLKVQPREEVAPPAEKALKPEAKKATPAAPQHPTDTVKSAAARNGRSLSESEGAVRRPDPAITRQAPQNQPHSAARHHHSPTDPCQGEFRTNSPLQEKERQRTPQPVPHPEAQPVTFVEPSRAKPFVEPSRAESFVERSRDEQGGPPPAEDEYSGPPPRTWRT